MGGKDVFGRLTCDLVTTVSSDTKTSLCACYRFSTGWILGFYTLCTCIYVEMDKDGVFLTTAVLPLAIEYTVVAKWRSLRTGLQAWVG